MSDYWMPEKSNILFHDDKDVPIILSYNWNPEGNPSALFIYFGNKEYKEGLWTFNAERFGREKIEKYWRNILELDKNKKLNLDSLCNLIDAIFIPEGISKVLPYEDKIRAN